MLGSGAATAGQPQPVVVSERAASGTPQVVANTAFPQPHVDALAAIGNRVFAGGLFDTVRNDNGTTVRRTHLFAYERGTSAVAGNFDARLGGGQVWALATDPATNSVYVGGDFMTVDGVSRPKLAKLDATTGALDTSFRAPAGGRVYDLKLQTVGGTKRLVAARTGTGKKLLSVNLATGADNGYFNLPISDPIPNAWGGVSVYQIAINPAGTRLVATGNFRNVDGESRTRFFMATLGSSSATLNSWYYPGFAKPCASTHPRRIAYLQGVDWSPDGSHFSVAATGQIPLRKSDIWYHRLGNNNLANTTVCDAVGRFALADQTKPQWINYTGGDSVWAVADTGAAVYTAGHFKWLDNPDGYGSIGVGDDVSGRPAVNRRGIGAINPATGLANSWDPGLTRTRIGGKAFLPTTTGLWVGNDATHFNGAPRYGFAFAPLP